MLLSKTGFPEEEELVLCTVTAIHFHSVFVTMDEYNNRTGMIHISEVAPGRIRNIRDFVKEGKKVVCKVLKINKEKGHIDLSLRRVNEAQKRIKLNQVKQEQLAENIVEYVAKQNKLDVKKLYPELHDKLKHAYLFEAFEQVMLGKLSLDDIGLESNIGKQLNEVILQRIKPPAVIVKGDFTITSYDPEGVKKIKTLLVKLAEEGTNVSYAGAGKYHFAITAKDYKEADKLIEKKVEEVLTKAKKSNIQASFKKIEA